MGKISESEYLKAIRTVQKFEAQEKHTKQVSVYYDASVSITVQVPDNWSPKEIEDQLKGGAFHDFEQDDELDIEYGKIHRLIVDGIDIILKNDN